MWQAQAGQGLLIGCHPAGRPAWPPDPVTWGVMAFSRCFSNIRVYLYPPKTF